MIYALVWLLTFIHPIIKVVNTKFTDYHTLDEDTTFPVDFQAEVVFVGKCVFLTLKLLVWVGGSLTVTVAENRYARAWGK